MKSGVNTEPLKAAKEKPKLTVGKTLLLFGLGSSTALFLCFLVAYAYSQPNWAWTRFNFPVLFLLSAVVLGASSYTINQLGKNFNVGNAKRLKWMFQLTIALTLAFIVFQVWGWGQLYANNIHIGGKPDGSYLYLISAIHALHVLGGAVPLLWLYNKAKGALNGSVEQFMYFNDKDELNRLHLLEWYWHFVDVVWVIILLFFLVNHV